MVNSPIGDERNYKSISKALLSLFVGICIALVALGSKSVGSWADATFGGYGYLIQVYLWGALGGLVASYKFLANDKELNELEAVKEKPDPAILRYPTDIDVYLYIQRVLISGVLGVVSSLLVLAGLLYFQVNTAEQPFRQRVFMAVLAFVVGLQENDFLSFLATLNRKLLRSEKAEKPKRA